MLEGFTEYLGQANLSENTIKSYVKAVTQYYELYDTVNKKICCLTKGI